MSDVVGVLAWVAWVMIFVGDVLACVACLREQCASMGDLSGVPAWMTYRSR